MNEQELESLLSQAIEERDNGDPAVAFQLFMRGALAGDAWCQSEVADLYDYGKGVEKDTQKSIYWSKKAWRTEKCSSFANNLAITYAQLGRYRPALFWFQKAIDMGSGSAALQLAKFLLKSKRRGHKKRVMALLQMVMDCEEPWQTCPYDKEVAQKLLRKLKLTSPAGEN